MSEVENISKEEKFFQRNYEKIKQRITFTKKSSSPRDAYRESENSLYRMIMRATSKLNSRWQPGELDQRKEEWDKLHI